MHLKPSAQMYKRASTWEAADDVCRQHQARHQAQQRVCDLFEICEGVVAVHGRQYCVRARLHWNVQIGKHTRMPQHLQANSSALVL